MLFAAVRFAFSMRASSRLMIRVSEPLFWRSSRPLMTTWMAACFQSYLAADRTSDEPMFRTSRPE